MTGEFSNGHPQRLSACNFLSHCYFYNVFIQRSRSLFFKLLQSSRRRRRKVALDFCVRPLCVLTMIASTVFSFALNEHWHNVLANVSLASTEHFSENDLTKNRALSTFRNMRARVIERSLKFCEYFEQNLNFTNTAKFWVTICYSYSPPPPACSVLPHIAKCRTTWMTSGGGTLERCPWGPTLPLPLIDENYKTWRPTIFWVSA